MIIFQLNIDVCLTLFVKHANIILSAEVSNVDKIMYALNYYIKNEWMAM